MMRVIAIAAALAAAGCTARGGIDVGLQSFKVTFTAEATPQPTGSADTPLPFISGTGCQEASDCQAAETCRDFRCSRCYRIDVRAADTEAESFSFSGTLHVDVTPGFVTPSTRYFQMTDGKADGVEVCINRTTGPTHIWVEEDGVDPKPDDVKYGQCNDGLDNDKNGKIDLADPGCLGIFDNREAPASLASGATDTMHFDNPTVRQIQLTDKVQTSPMRGQPVRVDTGQLVVTNVIDTGFYITDMGFKENDRPYNSIFLFTFSAPIGVQINDLVCWFSGTVDEHAGQTQLTFPSYYTHPQSDPEFDLDECQRDISFFLPDKFPRAPAGGGIDLTDLLKEEKDSFDSGPISDNSELLEAFESNLVKVRNIAVPTRLISCDRDKNGSIEPGDEQNCRFDCGNDNGCTDLESFFEYRQWLGRVDGKKQMGVSVALAADFTPLDIEFLGQEDQLGLCTREITPLGFLQYSCPPRTVSAVTGSLRHVYLCGSDGGNDCGLQFWVLDPRFNEDVIISGGNG